MKSAANPALTSLTSQDNAKDTDSKIEGLSQQITQGLARLNEINSEIKLAVSVEGHNTRRHVTSEADRVRADIRGEGQTTRQHVSKEFTNNREALVKDFQSTQQVSTAQTRGHVDTAHTQTRAHFEQQVKLAQADSIEKKRRSRFLNSFRFAELNDRRTQITDPEQGTYEWIFETLSPTKRHSFLGWLSSTAPMYWIQGKARSGKSTLMRFICEHEKTRELLDQSASPGSVTILSWYFWNSGSQAQRSLRGALYALIFQLLSAHPEAVSLLLTDNPSLSQHENPTDWSEDRLVKTFPWIVSRLPEHVTIFLDGLDEFDREGDVLALLSLLRTLASECKAKICLSSRPERLMEVELRHLPNLRLQDLTSHDINQYLDARLRPAFPHWEQIGLTISDEGSLARQMGCSCGYT